LGGDPHFAVYRIPVTEAQFNAVYSAISGYADQNPNYSLGTIDCVHAAAGSLLVGGVGTSLGLQFIMSTPGILPSQMYSGINLANGRPMRW
jgi:hypothetical protein